MEINGDHALSNGQCEQSMKPTCTESELRDKLTRYEQSHLMQFYDELNEQDQQKLLADISTVDFDDVNQFFDAVSCTCDFMLFKYILPSIKILSLCVTV